MMCLFRTCDESVVETREEMIDACFAAYCGIPVDRAAQIREMAESTTGRLCDECGQPIAVCNARVYGEMDRKEMA